MALIIFDFDGVLADTLDDLILFGQEVCDELGVQHTVNEKDLSNLEVMSFATFGQACEVPEHLINEFVQRCLKRFAEKKSPPAIFNGIGDVIREFASSHTLAIVTTNSSQNVNAFLTEHGLDAYVRAIYGIDTAGSKAQKISIAQSQFINGANPEPVYMIGDSLSDIKAAKEASVKSIAVTWGHQSLEHLMRGEPDFVVHNPHELLGVVEGRD